MSGRHYRKPFDWDFAGEWDGVVVYDRRVRTFVRYLDRNGEYREHVVSPKAWTIADIEVLREHIKFGCRQLRPRQRQW